MRSSMRSGGSAERSWFKGSSSRNWVALILLLAFSLMSCAVKQPRPDSPTIDAETVSVIRASVCRQPNPPQVQALGQLMADVLPADSTGRVIDLAPGQPLPDGAVAAARPDLYPAAEWITGTYCRCFPQQCQRPAPAAGPADDPDPISSSERGTPPAAEGGGDAMP